MRAGHRTRAARHALVGQEVGSAQALSLVERTPIDWSTHPEMRLWTRTLLRARTSHPALASGVAFSGNDEVLWSIAQATREGSTSRAWWPT